MATAQNGCYDPFSPGALGVLAQHPLETRILEVPAVVGGSRKGPRCDPSPAHRARCGTQGITEPVWGPVSIRVT